MAIMMMAWAVVSGVLREREKESVLIGICLLCVAALSPSFLFPLSTAAARVCRAADPSALLNDDSPLHTCDGLLVPPHRLGLCDTATQ
ncbi:hypothetical protein D8674_028581 [Pyrus ussuriensis x Pyrus communis]|uniref:Uncharacterized protein n=1 Tax=Pyrus ussuriensis x Pyrus communis TaxID=2448454 RepID=A0A5N5IA38_9ROSA|nr:hypothetical protein D8674_028581 [Pyrus ussuriensis x Pyrus communis]